MEELANIIKEIRKLEALNSRLEINEIINKEDGNKEYSNDELGELLQDLDETKDAWKRRELLDKINIERQNKLNKLNENLNKKMEQRIQKLENEIEQRRNKMEEIANQIKKIESRIENEAENNQIEYSNDKEGELLQELDETKDVWKRMELKELLEKINIEKHNKLSSEIKEFQVELEMLQNKDFEKILKKVENVQNIDTQNIIVEETKIKEQEDLMSKQQQEVEKAKIKREEEMAWEQREKQSQKEEKRVEQAAKKEIEEWDKLQDAEKKSTEKEQKMDNGEENNKKSSSLESLKKNIQNTINKSLDLENENVLQELGEKDTLLIDPIEYTKKFEFIHEGKKVELRLPISSMGLDLSEKTWDKIVDLKKDYDPLLATKLSTMSETLLNIYLDICKAFKENQELTPEQVKQMEMLPNIKYNYKKYLRNNKKLSKEEKLEQLDKANKTKEMFSKYNASDKVEIGKMSIMDKIYFNYNKIIKRFKKEPKRIGPTIIEVSERGKNFVATKEEPVKTNRILRENIKYKVQGLSKEKIEELLNNDNSKNIEEKDK